MYSFWPVPTAWWQNVFLLTCVYNLVTKCLTIDQCQQPGDKMSYYWSVPTTRWQTCLPIDQCLLPGNWQGFKYAMTSLVWTTLFAVSRNASPQCQMNVNTARPRPKCTRRQKLPNEHIIHIRLWLIFLAIMYTQNITCNVYETEPRALLQ